MKYIYSAISTLILSSGYIFAQSDNFPGVQDLREKRQEIGPLAVRTIENNLILAEWSSKSPFTARRIAGRVPADNDSTPGEISFSLSHIAPRSSGKIELRTAYSTLYSEGLRALLADKEFWSETTFSNYGPPGSICIVSIISFDPYGRSTLQAEMVKLGYAVVIARGSSTLIERYGDDFRDELLRLEGEARVNKLGIWKDKGAEQDAAANP